MNQAAQTSLQTRMYINGRWCDASDGRTLVVLNPATEETITEVAYGGRAEARLALEAASEAFETWRHRTAYERAAPLKKTADLLRERVDEIGAIVTMEQGKPLAESKSEVLAAAAFFEWNAEECKRLEGRIVPPSLPSKRHFVVYHPRGVCAAISPSNFPVLLPVRKISAALAAGCTCVARPDRQTPLSLIKVFQCLEEAGLPPGVCNLVLGPPEEMADEFLESRLCQMISFTGSTRVGQHLMRRAADQVKKLLLELGGHAPFLVLKDADPQLAAQAAILGKFRNNGQTCISPSRFYVHEALAGDFTEAVVEQTRRLKQGPGLEPGTEIGPMVSEQALAKTLSLVQDAVANGARLLCGGRRSSKFQRGYFFEPTVLDQVRPQVRLMQEEPFSPILPIIPFEKTDEAIEAANNTPYGLAAYVLTRDISTAVRVAEGLAFGVIGINDFTPATAQCPFGGMKASGSGREGGHEGIQEYLETKYISLAL